MRRYDRREARQRRRRIFRQDDAADRLHKRGRYMWTSCDIVFKPLTLADLTALCRDLKAKYGEPRMFIRMPIVPVLVDEHIFDRYKPAHFAAPSAH